MAVHYYAHRHTHAVHTNRVDAALRAAQIVWFLLAVVEAVLLLRFGLRLLGANSGAPFVSMIYQVSAVLLDPFRAMLPAVREGRSVLEWSTLIAMLVYWLIALVAVRIISLFRPRENYVVEEDRTPRGYA